MGEIMTKKAPELVETGSSGRTFPLPQPLPRGRGATPGTLRLVRGAPNPNGAEQAQLFLLAGDPTAAPVREIIPDEGLTLPPAPEGLAEQSFRLCLLHCNDLHGHISRLTSQGDRPILSRIVWRLHELRHRFRAAPRRAVLFLSAGDDLMGVILGELLGDDPESYGIHAGYHLYSAAGLDVGVRFLIERTVAEVREHEMALCAELWDGLAAIDGVRLHGPPDANRRGSALSITIDGFSPGDAAAILDSSFSIAVRSGLHCANSVHPFIVFA